MVSWYRSGVLSNIDQGFCPTLAMAFEAYEPHFVYKPWCPLHPLELSVFVLSIQSIRLVGFLTDGGVGRPEGTAPDEGLSSSHSLRAFVFI
jgi:hypothetical protein